MKKSTMLILLVGGGVGAYFLWKKWKDTQRAAAHPITMQPDANIIRPLPVNPALVTDAVIIS